MLGPALDIYKCISIPETFGTRDPEKTSRNIG